MGKSVFIAEKPSVAQEFAKALKVHFGRRDGFLEADDYIVTWCVGHLVTMSYPECYDTRLKRWSLETLPFLPKEFKYEVIPAVSKQFGIVKSILTRDDVETIYVCTDSGREGEYIYRLVEQMAGVTGKKRKRVWIDSQTEEEILKGIHNAKDLSEYDNLSEAAYLRAKEDYLMGINFSRLLTLKYGRNIATYLRADRIVLSVGRVMTCVLGMVVRREREVREFVKTPFFRVIAEVETGVENSKKKVNTEALANTEAPANIESTNTTSTTHTFEAEWRVTDKSKYFESPFLYKDNGFKEREKAKELITYVSDPEPVISTLNSIEKKKDVKNPPLLYNLAELQNECSKLFKISPDETLKIIQELYEKKLVTYPRTDARVLTTAVCKEIHKNIGGLRNYILAKDFASEILEKNMYKNIDKTKYCNDKQVTDHYAIIPTGQGFGALNSLSATASKAYEIIVRRFLSIFYPAAQYQKISLTTAVKEENFFASFKVLVDEGYLKVINYSFTKVKEETEDKCDAEFFEMIKKLKKGDKLPFNSLTIKEGETSPPKRYSSGSIILAMENAGQLIEDDDLRAQIKGSGIGTSATRAEILKKLDNNKYIAINKKTQIIMPTLLGEIIFDVVYSSIKHLLNPELTASWEKGLTYVAEGSITSEEYMVKLENFVRMRTSGVLKLNNQSQLNGMFNEDSKYYK
ncbi:DNA topoisomerase [[Clostridium] fimetarium]|uniref:DNA topoisomerase n=1 Tax=[Clostridium] fimetarium TaxID=99656 RepID=A0A1I0MUD2_9FIRM|nr:DNA topoisomerase [[Clostridium] fimetarium]SEV92117.1 DNA topoisomerase-3 [[Clostridium] fimetarium]